MKRGNIFLRSLNFLRNHPHSYFLDKDTPGEFGLYARTTSNRSSPVGDLLKGSQQAATPTTLPTASPNHRPTNGGKIGPKPDKKARNGAFITSDGQALRQTSICYPFWGTRVNNICIFCLRIVCLGSKRMYQFSKESVVI